MEDADYDSTISTSTCPHCRREIPSSNIALHSAHCARNLQKCEHCGDMVPRKLMDGHYDENHAPMNCSLCKHTVERQLWDLHTGIQCPQRMLACQYCQFELPAVDLFEHQDVCGNRTEYCQGCRKYIRLREWIGHELQFHTILNAASELSSDRTPAAAAEQPVPKPARPATGSLHKQLLLTVAITSQTTTATCCNRPMSLQAAAAPAAGAVDEETPASTPPSDASKGVENLVIIGSGPAGYTAAIYAARANLKPVVFEGYQVGGVPGGQLMTTTEVENFPGFPEGITGPDLMDRMRKQAEHWGAELHQEDVEFVNVKSSPFVIRSSDREVKCHSLIIATGATAKRLRLPREDEFWSRGISACAICDGASPLFKGQVLAVVGGGDVATEEAIYLTKYARHVHLLVRKDKLRASKAMQDRVLNNPNITVHFNTEAMDVVSNDKGQMSGIHLKRRDTGEESVLQVKGLFYGIGHTPNSQLLQGQIELDSAGYILVKEGSAKTSVDGVFAAGDVQDHEWRQAITAAGSGCIAALSVERYLVANDLLVEFHQPVQEETKKDITDKDVEMGFDISHRKHKGQYALRKLYHESPRLICVLYTSPTCGPCRTLKPILNKVIDEYGEFVHLVEIDIEEDPEIAEAAGIMGTPCVQFFKNKEMLRTVSGVKNKKEYREFIEANK